MRNLKLLVFYLALLPLAMLTVPVAAQIRTPGVTLGDWFKYSVTFGGNGTAPPPLFEDFIEVQWVRVQVISVSGTNVTEQATRHYLNGSETIHSGWVDVDTGNYTDRYSGSIDFISGNLSVGDVIYSSPESINAIITATGLRAYPGGTRETNYAPYYAGPWKVDYYWDRSTGAVVEHFANYEYQDGADKRISSILFILVDSGVWVVPEFSPMLLLALFVTLPLVAVVYKRKQPKTPAR